VRVLFVSSGNSSSGINPIIRKQGESLIKLGVDLRFKSLIAGTNISLTPTGIPLLHLDLGFIEGTTIEGDDPTAFVSDYTTPKDDIVDTIIFWAQKPTIRQIEFRWKLTPFVYEQLQRVNPNLDPSRVQF
jgi:hypothetical protein